ncbi:MAG: Gfo/Idh/MocA family oxidoreductase [Verrucomicrobiales bacterium]|nr:Gfo/Idh/MocA family oxidoreductase [Verrucomicrobiales bacterium]MCP5526278.1 Gfo/Idh/MocA family oxidoreductase [Verrucomicrobiales bacterium]
MSNWNRRSFTKALALASAATAVSRTRVLGANERVRLGFIGVGNRGDQVLDAFLAQPDAQVAAVCDLHPPYMEFAARKIGGEVARVDDWRRVIEMKDLDAIVVCTPDHWHAPQMIAACEAGKDVYVEKPLSLRVAEGRRMVDAARVHNRVVQVGIHRRSSAMCRQAAEFVRNGGLGTVTMARAFHVQNEGTVGIGNPPDEAPPPGFSWEDWLGPAPAKPYNANRTFYRFRWFYDYSGGQLTNFGTHYLDFIHWALGHDAPLAVTAMGGKFAVQDNREIPDTLEVLWQYPGGTLVSFMQVNSNAALPCANGAHLEIRGTNGTLYLYYDRFEVVPESAPTLPFPQQNPLDRTVGRAYQASYRKLMAPLTVRGSQDTAPHARDFLDCLKDRRRCNCDIETGHRSTTATLIGNVAHQLRAWLAWDGTAERFANHDEANQWLDYRYRKG